MRSLSFSFTLSLSFFSVYIIPFLIHFFSLFFRLNQKSTVLFDQIFVSIFLRSFLTIENIKIHIESLLTLLELKKKWKERQKTDRLTTQQMQRIHTYTGWMYVFSLSIKREACHATETRSPLVIAWNVLQIHTHTHDWHGSKTCTKQNKTKQTHSLQMLQFYAIKLVIYQMFYQPKNSNNFVEFFSLLVIMKTLLLKINWWML